MLPGTKTSSEAELFFFPPGSQEAEVFTERRKVLRGMEKNVMSSERRPVRGQEIQHDGDVERL